LIVKFHDGRPANVFKITKYTYTNDSDAQARRAARMSQHRAHRDHQPSRFIESIRTAEGIVGAQCLDQSHVHIGQLMGDD
jgi:hypothetical protein